MTIVTPPPQVLNAARAAGQLSRHQSAAAATRAERGEDESMCAADEARLADESTQVVPARHRYRDVAAAAPDLVRIVLARWRHQAIECSLLRADRAHDGTGLARAPSPRPPPTTGLLALRGRVAL